MESVGRTRWYRYGRGLKISTESHCSPPPLWLHPLQILPMENVDGRTLAEAGQLCERKNGRGVDTNRNWDIDWGKKEKDYDPSEEYPGKAPHRWVGW